MTRRELFRIFRAFSSAISDLFWNDVRITIAKRRFVRILDVSGYAPAQSREIEIRMHPRCIEFRYDIPIADSSRTENANHWIVFVPRSERSGHMRVYKWPYGYEELGYCVPMASLVQKAFSLPWSIDDDDY